MILRRDDLDDLAKAKLAKSAYELGLEVGEQGHQDAAGWVWAELRQMLQQAEELQVVDVVRRRYEFGKEKGLVRRHEKYDQAASGGRAVAKPRAPAMHAPPEPAKPEDMRFAERVTAEEGVWSTISVMRFAHGNEEVQTHLGNFLAAVADLHDRIMQMPQRHTPEKTFDSALRMLSDVGWLSTYDVKLFNERGMMTRVETTSMLARSFGKCETPMCLPICNVMETVGLKAFGKQVLAVEESCMAQGHDHCTFNIFPREVPREEGI